MTRMVLDGMKIRPQIQIPLGTLRLHMQECGINPLPRSRILPNIEMIHSFIIQYYSSSIVSEQVLTGSFMCLSQRNKNNVTRVTTMDTDVTDGTRCATIIKIAFVQEWSKCILWHSIA